MISDSARFNAPEGKKKKKGGAAGSAEDPAKQAAAAAASAKRIAVEALEHVMDKADLEALALALERYAAAAAGTDALWRATHMRKSMLLE
eukprot:1013716-Prymnesium_polylepis.1